MTIGSYVIDTYDKKLWNYNLNLIPDHNKDIYYFSNYVNLYRNTTNHPKCFIYKSEENVFLSIHKKSILKSSYYDLITPYGYGVQF